MSVFPLRSSLLILLAALLAAFFAAEMQSNIRAGLRQVHKHSAARSSSASLVRAQAQPQVASASTSALGGQRTVVQTTASRRAVPFSLTGPSAHMEERDERVVRMLMFGKPGAGKGTLTGRLAQKYDIVTLSTGDLIRQHIMEQTEVGRVAEGIVAAGGLLSDEIMLKMVMGKLDRLESKNWILDGFPRTVAQGQMFDAELKKSNTPLTLVVNLDVPDEVILSRISDRWVHLPSGRVYNMSYNRPKVEGFDDHTGEPLTKRPDDNPEIFARRLDAFYASTSPLLAYFAKTAASSGKTRPNSNQHPHQLSFPTPSGLKVKTLSGTTSDEIWPQLDSLLLNTFPGLRARIEPKQTKLRQIVSNAIAAEHNASASNSS
ncbi:hypothetical protein D9619_005632 [Psilocybe cf. subviscida]|uniref:Adenylate kinase active site lid domain-containing protein n=1 Tax=Psilocybe cf. subviscida TaxID=2480587 RepID=A0A8H5FBI2_9AGAR|nr:hypothetical protein D9619_005632 [Psilocybe cf. subviscida]